jgi:putative ABC transport system permease protein
VLERANEIGVRRAIGARPWHIMTQFLAESGVLGFMGGLAGTSVGVLIVLGTAIANHWTAVIDPATVLPAPLAGAAIGLTAGAYPSLRAASIEPAEALRR